MQNTQQENYPVMQPVRKTGEEVIPGTDCTLLNFWQWAYSSVMDNTERGVFAEWLVARALDADHGVRIEWDKYDICTAEGIRVEVKSSGYLQTWSQKHLSRIVFSVPKTRGWNGEEAAFDPESKRQSDIYVFCVHHHQMKDTANPLDVTQWSFYVLLTRQLDRMLGNQRTISLSGLLRLGAVQTDYAGLRHAVYALYHTVRIE